MRKFKWANINLFDLIFSLMFQLFSLIKSPKTVTYLNLTNRFEVQITMIFPSKSMVCVCTSFHSHKQVRVHIPLKRKKTHI